MARPSSGAGRPERTQRLVRALERALGSGKVRQGELLSKHTTLRVGGPADLLVLADTLGDLRQAVLLAAENKAAWRVLGSGANLLASDAGFRGLVVVNRAGGLDFGVSGVRAESGASLAGLARECVMRGLAGLEWAAGIPGTVGGAVVGNAGAWGSEVASVLVSATLLEPDGSVVEWPVERLEYGYRTSVLKRRPGGHAGERVVLEARFALVPGDRAALQARAAEMQARRRATQPAGASCGSVFRNPPGDFAGRLIEAAGLKGSSRGGAQISPIHANFVVNTGDASAVDVRGLIELAQESVRRQFGTLLELEIELFGEWSPPRMLRVGVLFGGRSGEHEVSLMSAQGVMGALDRNQYEVVPIGITKEGRWLASGDPMKALTTGLQEASRPSALLPDPCQAGLLALDRPGPDRPAAQTSEGRLDVIFPVLHGPLGEDGTVQGLLELAGIPYVGAGVAASAVGMDKALFKEIMKARGLPVARWQVVKRREWMRERDAVLGRIESELGYDCFVKPANLGSSVGISKAHNRAELAVALDEAARYDRKLLVEAAVNAREIEVSVLGNDEPIASVPGEIVPCNEFYDYAAKYLDGKSELLVPAPIGDEAREAVQRLAIEAYLAIDCAGMARVDFLLDRESGEVYINELNTLPGFTPISMYPKLWEASGISYPELLSRLIDLALERHADKSQSETSYSVPQRGDEAWISG